MQSNPRSIISIRPPSSTGNWSVVALDRRLPETVESERELQAGCAGFELWVKPPPDECEVSGIEALAHSESLLRWHRDNAIKVLQNGLTRDLRSLKAVHLAPRLLAAVLPPEDAPERFARVLHVRQLAAMVVQSRQAVASGLSTGEQALLARLELLSQPAHEPETADDEDDATVTLVALPLRATGLAVSAALR